MNMPYPYGYTIFCDDIRDEVGGKTSFIGTYRGVMRIHGDLPITLPKFCIYAVFVGERGRQIDELVLSIFLPGDTDVAPSITGQVSTVDINKPLPGIP